MIGSLDSWKKKVHPCRAGRWRGLMASL